MQKNNILWWTMVIALLLAGFIIGWTTKPSGKVKETCSIKIHDTLKTSSIQFKIIPGTDYNIDSLITVINQFWKDSLKSIYGKGLFESTFSKVDDFGKREYTLDSRIPIDPQSQLTFDESFVFPKRKFGLVGSIGSSCALGLKYYLHDSQRYLITGQVGREYMFSIKGCNYYARLELEIKI